MSNNEVIPFTNEIKEYFISTDNIECNMNNDSGVFDMFLNLSLDIENKNLNKENNILALKKIKEVIEKTIDKLETNE